MTERTMTPLKSSAIESYHYDPETRDLTIKLTSGRTYVYSGVSMERVVAFTEGGSHGSYYNKRIKGVHPHREITE